MTAPGPDPAPAPPKRRTVLRLGHGVSGIHRDPDRLARNPAELLAALVERAAPGLELDRSSEARLRDFVGGLDRGQRLRLEGALHLIGDGQ